MDPIFSCWVWELFLGAASSYSPEKWYTTSQGEELCVCVYLMGHILDPIQFKAICKSDATVDPQTQSCHLL
jgi:hypothetical protein